MKVIKIGTDYKFTFAISGEASDTVFTKGYYATTNNMANFLAKQHKENIKIQEEDNLKIYSGQDLTNKKILVCREGGAGDLLFMSPCLKYIKDKFNCEIGLSTGHIYIPLYKGSNFVSRCHHTITPMKEVNYYDYILSFENIIEFNPKANERDAYDLFFDAFFIDTTTIPDESMRPILNVPEGHLTNWSKYIKEAANGKKAIGFQFYSSAPIRNPPPIKLIQTMQLLGKDDYAFFIIEHKSKKDEIIRLLQAYNIPATYLLTETLLDVAAVIDSMDLLIGPDSSGGHIAQARNTPHLGLFGPFRSDVRYSHYKNAMAIDVTLQKCGRGCFAHTQDSCDFWKDMGSKFAPCWYLLQPETIRDCALELLNGRKDL